MARNRQTMRDLVVRKPFRFGGRAFRPGDEFRPDRLACSERKLARLIGSRMVVERGEMEEASAKTAALAERREAVREAMQERREAGAAAEEETEPEEGEAEETESEPEGDGEE